MLLRDYLAREGLTYSAFAVRIGSNHARTVQRYALGQQIPDKTMMLRIVDATNSEVTPNDFFGIEASGEDAASMSPGHMPADIGGSPDNGGGIIGTDCPSLDPLPQAGGEEEEAQAA